MKRKLISVILAVFTLLGVVPSVVYAEVIEKFEDDNNWIIIPFKDKDTSGEEIYNSFLDSTDVTPSGNGLIKPYATDTVMLLEQSEIFTWASYNNSVSGISISDNFVFKGVTDSTAYRFQTNNKQDISTTNIKALCYATGVAFDPTGCGRKNYIAVLGFYHADLCKNSAAYLYIFNGDTKSLVKAEELDKSFFYWMYDVYGNLDLDNVDAGNFFQITAGDYNGDGKDSLVFYHGYVTKECALYQYDYNSEKNTGALTKIGLYTGYLNSGWYADGSNGSIAGTFWAPYNTNGMMHKALNVCLESGDIDGDGIDDLVVVSNTGGLSKSEANGNLNQVKTTVVVGFGEKGVSSIANLKLSGQKTIYDSSTGYTLSSPGVSIGDIDGDGENEVVVAGFINKPTEKDPNQVQNKAVGFTYYKHKVSSGNDTIEQKNGLQVLKDDNISPISKGDSLRAGHTNHEETLYQQFSVECVNFDGSDSKGQKSKDYIFLNGYVYLLNSSNNPQKVSVATTGTELFSKVTTYMYGDDSDKYDIDEVFILSAAVGNFTNSSNGEESLSLTVGFHVNYNKSKDASSNAYYVGEVTISKCKDKGNSREGMLCAAYSFNLTLLEQSSSYYGYVTNEMVNAESKDNGTRTYKKGFDGMSFIRVACDVGTDSILGEYVDTEAFYSDPEVVAVLQAAPYFEELGAGNSSTIYSYSETYGKTSGNGYDFTVGFGVCAEIETSHFKMEVEETIKSSLSEEFEESVETTYTTEFEANDLNQIILRRKLFYNYIYKIKTYDGKLPDGLTDSGNGYICITTLRNPSVSALTFEQYKKYAEVYNQKMEESGNNARLNIISETNLDHYHLLNNEGNPGGYASSLKEYGDSAFSMAKDNTWVELSNASGTITQQFEKAIGSSYTQTTSKGVEVNLKVMGGASFAGNGAFAGVQANMEYISEQSTTTSTVKTTTTSGTVQGIDSKLTNYAFQWQLIGWKTSSDYPMFNKDVLFVGYLVQNVKSLPQTVTDLEARYSPETDTVTLTWTAPTIDDDRPEITEFRVYQDGESIKYVANKGEGEEHTLTVDVSGNDTASTTFYILSRASVKGSMLQSIESNVVTAILAMTKKQTTALVREMLEDVEAKTEALEAELAKKADSDDLSEAVSTLTTAITELTEAYKEADELLAQDIDAANSAIEALKAALESADAVLQEAIDAVQANLDSAVADLNEALAAGDQANADALTNATTTLTKAYKAADALLKSNIEAKLKSDVDTINNEIAELKTAMEEANKTLQEAIDLLAEQNEALKNDLDAAKEQFNSEIEAIKAELTELRSQLSDQNDRHDADIRTVTDVNGQQDEKQHTNKVIAIIGLSISAVSLLGNIGLITYTVIRKKTPLA